MVKPRSILWTLAFVFLVAPTLWLGYHAFFAPPTYVSTSKMMLAGKLSISSEPLPPAPRHSFIDRDTVYGALVLVAIYTPGITLAILAALRSRRSSAVSPPTI